MKVNQELDILYGRLSQEDELKGDSNSIQNQRMLLEKYARDNGFTNERFMYDDGYSGTNFNRPAWSRSLKTQKIWNRQTSLRKRKRRTTFAARLLHRPVHNVSL